MLSKLLRFSFGSDDYLFGKMASGRENAQPIQTIIKSLKNELALYAEHLDN